MKRKRLHSRVSRGGIINTSVGSIFLPLRDELLSSALFSPLASRLSHSQPTTCRLGGADRETLHQRALHVNAITLKMNPPRELRNNFPQVGVACTCDTATRMYCKQLSFYRCVWHMLPFIDRKSNAQDAYILNKLIVPVIMKVV